MNRFIVLLFILGTTVAQAQTLTLERALETAVRNYPSLKARQAEISASRFETEVTKAQYLPTVNWQNQALYATSNQVRGTFFPNEGTAIPTSGGIKANGYTPNAVWTSFSTLLVNWRVINFGKYRADLASARASEATAQAALDRALFEHKVLVSDAYLLALIFDQAIRIQQANLARVQAFRTVLTANAEAGLRPGVDSALAAAEVSKAQLLLLDSRRMAESQRVKLAELTGIPSDSLLRGTLQLDTLTFRKPGPQAFATVTPDPVTNPVLRYYMSRVNLGKARETAIQKSFLPSISALGAGWARGSGISDRTDADGNFSYNSSLGAGLPFRAYNYMLGLSMNWRVSDLFITRREAQAQHFRTEAAQQDLAEQTLNVRGEQENAALQLRNAYEAVVQAPIQLSAAQAAFSQASARYAAGLSSILELTQATTLLNRAEIDQSVATNNVWRFLLLKAAANGNLEDFMKLIPQR